MFVYLREEGSYPVYLMCRWARVSRSGYYRWRNQGLSETQKRREELTILITHFFHESDQTYGYRRIHAALVERGVHASLRSGASAHAPGWLGGLSAPETGPYHHPGPGSSPPPGSGEKEFHRQQTRAEMGRRYHLHPHLGRIHLSSNRHGLLLEKDHRLCDRREYAHPACCRGFTHGSQKSTPYRGRDCLPFGSWFAIHLS